MLPSFEVQSYLKTHKMNNYKVSLLFALRSKSSKHFKSNFPSYAETMCPVYGKEEDSQEHWLECEVIYPPSIRNNNIEYDIFNDNVSKQAAVTQLFSSLIERREDASASITGPSSCPGSPGQAQQLIM